MAVTRGAFLPTVRRASINVWTGHVAIAIDRLCDHLAEAEGLDAAHVPFGQETGRRQASGRGRKDNARETGSAQAKHNHKSTDVEHARRKTSRLDRRQQGRRLLDAAASGSVGSRLLLLLLLLVLLATMAVASR